MNIYHHVGFGLLVGACAAKWIAVMTDLIDAFKSGADTMPIGNAFHVLLLAIACLLLQLGWRRQRGET